jgi:hypothetical protein
MTQRQQEIGTDNKSADQMCRNIYGSGHIHSFRLSDARTTDMPAIQSLDWASCSARPSMKTQQATRANDEDEVQRPNT